MRAFGELYGALENTTSTKAKVAAMADYFRQADPADAAWAVYFLSGRRPKRLLGSARLRQWLADIVDLPPWLIDECYSAVGDLAETVALLTDGQTRPAGGLAEQPLAVWLERHLLPLGELGPERQRPLVLDWWRRLDRQGCYLLTKLLTGSLRVGVSQTLVVRALAEVAGADRALIAHRLAGRWRPTADFYRALLGAGDDPDDAVARPYPFYLASPLDAPASADRLGRVDGWLAEWKWDGIRAQLIRRRGQTFLWSRGEELINHRFPELTAAAEALADGSVLDGEILAWKTGPGVLPFADLQRRLGRKTVGKTLLAQVPVVLLAYDVLEADGVDLRQQPLSARRRRLRELLAGLPAGSPLRLSPALDAASWDELAARREQSRSRRVEGLMLKKCDAPYGVGRQKGAWWKWKIDPYTIDAVMIYAQAGHGRRASLFTDYTFAVWHDDRLVPVAKAYSGLSNDEIERLDRWIRRNTVERFGPVRSVPPTHVFELAFEGISHSGRHKSGVALRFPRIQRWRDDLGIRDADTLDQVKALIDD